MCLICVQLFEEKLNFGKIMMREIMIIYCVGMLEVSHGDYATVLLFSSHNRVVQYTVNK